MPSSFTWLDHSDAERRKVLDAIDRFKESDTRDELGLARIRDGFSELFFPGTSVLMTRARYFLFVPWIYQELERKRVTEGIEGKVRRAEVELIETLGDNEGVIGRQAKATLKRMPSNIYWLGIGEWGVRRFDGTQSDLHNVLEHERAGQASMRDDEGESLESSRRVWHAALALKPAERIALRNGAGRASWSFRSLFNHPEVMSMLRGGARGLTGTPYWREVLRYCADGCLPAVLDEYVHVLRDHLGLMSGSIGDRVHEIADEICEAVELRRSRVGLDDFAVSPSGRTVKREARNLRTHFAVRFGDEKNEDGTEGTRADQVRKAFNSPFWPFVLGTATTLAMTTAAPTYAPNPRWRCALTTLALFGDDHANRSRTPDCRLLRRGAPLLCRAPLRLSRRDRVWP